MRIRTFRTARQVEQAAKAEREYDQRRARETETRREYKTARWQRKRAAQLQEQPLCERCLAQGLIVPATVANHKIPHRGDIVLFWEGELESTCDPCHNSVIQTEERAAARQRR